MHPETSGVSAAVVYDRGLIEMACFVLVLAVGYIHVWKRGALWN